MSKNDDMIKLVRLFEDKQFAGEPEQKPGDQVRGTDKAEANGKQHPFHNRLVGEEISLEDKLSKRYQDMKDVQAKEKEQKKKEESDKQDVAEKVGQIDELSTATLTSYKNKARAQVQASPGATNYNAPTTPKIANRARGAVKADNRLHGFGPVKKSTQGVAEDAVADFMARGGQVQQGKFHKPRKSERTDYGSRHIGGVRDAVAGKAGKTLGRAAATNFKGGGKAVVGEEFGGENSPVSQAITRRILLQRTDLLSKYGPEKVMSAIDEVADFVGDVDEIGSSDVSGWIRHVEQMLGNMEEGIDEDMSRRGFLRGLGAAALGAAGVGAASQAQGKVRFDADGNEIRANWKNVQGAAPAQGPAATTGANTTAGSAASSPSAASRAAANDAADAAAKIRYTNPKFRQEYEPIENAYNQNKSRILSNTRYSPNPDLAKRQQAEFVKMLIALDLEFAEKTNALLKQYGRLKEQGMAEAENPADKITLDVPLMIRIMEYAREDAQDDVDLHNVAEQLVRLSAMGKTLGMNDYDGIVGVTTEQKLSELGAVPPAPPQGTATANAAPTSGSVSPNEQTALNKIQTNPAMKQQFDKLMTQATPGAANKPMALDPAQTDALEKIKTNAGLKSQYDRLIKQANPGATP